MSITPDELRRQAVDLLRQAEALDQQIDCEAAAPLRTEAAS